MLRITTGIAKNKRLKIPNIEGFRGVQEKAKLSLFSIIGDDIKGAVCLDLFAGSGNMGLEALSRGASWCDFVDESSTSVESIEFNINDCGFLEMSEVFRRSAVKYISFCNRKYDVCFIDPFYSQTSLKHLMKELDKVLKESGKVFYFHASSFDPKELLEDTNLKIIDSRRFGESVFEVIELKR